MAGVCPRLHSLGTHFSVKGEAASSRAMKTLGNHTLGEAERREGNANFLYRKIEDSGS